MSHEVVRRAHAFSEREEAMLKAHAISEIGAGEPPLVLLHGFGTDQTIWGKMAPELSAKRRVVLYDHMGSGASDFAHYDADRYRTLEGYADDLVEILDALDLRDVSVAGHSVSGMISLLASLRTDRIGRLIMIGASPRYLNDGSYEGGFEPKDVEDFLGLMELDFQGWARALAPRVMDQPDNPSLTQELVFSFSRENAELTRRFAEATFTSDYRAHLSECRVPAAILQAKADVVVPLAAARFLADHIPRARLEIMNVRGHYPQLSAPDVVVDAIERFLAETPS
ncbi:alpha/beta fold hydrolase [Caulobacter segnis]|uniref:Alpha/beta hydrolase fold protein n=2 Tax=Caulobacter segnis TaxID=88688 RepID=D5VHT0_CAUST|nr:alpha/beta hydrolase [Caulobacter segnis]ADG09061.1 alpha/beta hydrolase fold protein [Caulobacter segnis ATCC 21756]